MPVGYSSRCRVCNSPYRAEIEQWCSEEGLSPRAAAQRLHEQHGERISHQSIWKHMQEHFNVKAEALRQYEQSLRQMDKLVQKQLNEIDMLDRVAATEFELHQATGQWLAELVAERKKLPMALVVLHEKSAGELRQAIKQKTELLGDDPMSRLADGVATWAELVQAAADDG